MSKLTLTPLANEAGFTLIEVMVTVIVIGIIAAIAAPNISLQLANQRIKSTTATLESALKEARSESVIYRIPIMVSYDNDDLNSINIETPYSGPPLYFSYNNDFDWTNLFIKSAVAYSKPPSQGSNNNQGNQGNNNNQGSGNNQGSNNNQGSGNNQGNNNDQSSSNNQGSNNDQANGNGQTENGKDPVGGDQSGSGSEDHDDLEIQWVIAKNYKYSDKNTIKSDPKTIIFKPSKQANHAITYTICDTNKSATSRQITVSKLGIITSQVGGVC